MQKRRQLLSSVPGDGYSYATLRVMRVQQVKHASRIIAGLRRLFVTLPDRRTANFDGASVIAQMLRLRGALGYCIASGAMTLIW